MMKTLRYFFVAALAMVGMNAMADDVVFDFNTMDLPVSYAKSGDTPASEAGDITETWTNTLNGVTVTVSPADEGKTANRFWKTNNGPQLRCYSGTIILTASQAMKGITFDAPKFAVTASVGTLAEKVWSGEATEVIFTVTGNTQINKITVSFDGGGSVTPPDPQPTGETGTFENPLTVTQVLAAVQAMDADVVSTADYVFKGKVSTVKYTFSAQYGTATFNISDDGQAANEFTCYGVYTLENKPWVEGNTQIAVGDEVIVCGKVVNYQGTTPETSNKKAYIYSLNGKTKEDTPTPQVERINVAQALEIINALEAGAVTSETYEIEGFVVNFTETFDPQYGNYTFEMADAENGTSTLLAYRVKNADNQKFTEDVLKLNDKVVVKAQLQKYVKNEVVTPETKNGVILTINGQATGIENVSANTINNGVMYNVAGQVVNKGYKGLVIMNGRKFMNK